MTEKVAIVTGVSGQDGSYLAELLLEKNYTVVGVRRRTSAPNNDNIFSCLSNPNFEVVMGDITDYACVSGIVDKYHPDEVYNLAAQSFVKASFDQPFHTFEVDTLGVVNWLEVIRKQLPTCRFYQASTSEMFGKNFDEQTYWHRSEKYQDENTSFAPQSPYGIAKLASHHMVQLYREAYKLHASCGILFNHESPRRGKEFVTRKITDYVGKLAHHIKESTHRLPVALESGEIVDALTYPRLCLGNLDSYRDWGHAKDYVRGMWQMLQCDKPDDYILCTGTSHSVRDFCKAAFDVIEMDYKDYVVIDPQFYRPAEVDFLKGVSDKATAKFGWINHYLFEDLVKEMVEADIARYNG